MSFLKPVDKAIMLSEANANSLMKEAEIKVRYQTALMQGNIDLAKHIMGEATKINSKEMYSKLKEEEMKDIIETYKLDREINKLYPDKINDPKMKVLSNEEKKALLHYANNKNVSSLIKSINKKPKTKKNKQLDYLNVPLPEEDPLMFDALTEPLPEEDQPNVYDDIEEGLEEKKDPEFILSAYKEPEIDFGTEIKKLFPTKEYNIAETKDKYIINVNGKKIGETLKTPGIYSLLTNSNVDNITDEDYEVFRNEMYLKPLKELGPGDKKLFSTKMKELAKTKKDKSLNIYKEVMKTKDKKAKEKPKPKADEKEEAKEKETSLLTETWLPEKDAAIYKEKYNKYATKRTAKGIVLDKNGKKQKLQFGQFYIDRKKLMKKNILSISDKNNKKLNGFPNMQVSEDVKKYFLTSERPINTKRYNLSSTEKAFIKKLVDKLDVDCQLPKSKLKAIQDDKTNKLLDSLTILHGEIKGGNTSREVQNNLINVLTELVRVGVISKDEALSYADI